MTSPYLAALGAAPLLLLSSAFAQDQGKVYLGIGAGAGGFPGASETFEVEVVSLSDPSLADLFADSNSEEDLELSPAFALKLLAGYRMTDSLALEVERSARGAVFDADENLFIGTVYTGVNAVFYPQVRGRLRPYIGVGAGYGALALEDESSSNSFPGEESDYDGVLTFQLKSGALLPLGRSHALGLEAAYYIQDSFEAYTDPVVGGGGAELDLTSSFELNSFEVTLNYRFQFGGFSR
ncbi:outer membrane beta-barrel protein [Parvularcula maris]|uniref:Outer membrane beta-barrel protein n=1 Tax=Parvularcula maris TaxID=2965077 RepID=A0A9X2L7D1_9PROT|nr:outer membrane beta-barrel protein [Parvularcula maris]MCQ8184420.1 outer membrane beta-barrel protein [Parvularcula maris]